MALLAVGGVAACSSSKSTSTTPAGTPAALSQTSGAAASAGGGGGGGGQATASALIALASKGTIYGPPTGTVDPSALHAATAADIKAFSYRPLGKVKKVAVVVASRNAAQLVQLGDLVAAALGKLNIGSQQFYGDFTPTGAQSAVNSALASDPSAIVLLTITPASVTPQLATAKSRKIPVVDGTSSEAVDGGGLPGYGSASQNLIQVLQAAYIVAHGGPKASSVWLTLPTFPAVETSAGVAYLKAVCSTCTVVESPMTQAQQISPVSFGQLITSTARAHPSAQFITTPAGCIPLSAAQSALKQAGSKAVFSTGDCTATSLGAMNAGDLPYVATSSEGWTALVDVDQVLRLLSGQPAAASAGPGAYMITKDNEPTSSTQPTGGVIDRWELKRFDFAAPYSKAWGVDVSSIFTDEK